MKETILTNNHKECIKFVFDEVRFSLVKEHKNGYDPQPPVVITLNPIEARIVKEFIGKYLNQAFINAGYKEVTGG